MINLISDIINQTVDILYQKVDVINQTMDILYQKVGQYNKSEFSILSYYNLILINY